MLEENKGLNGFHLKLICIITMFIDHVGASIFERWYAEGGHFFDPAFGNITMYNIYFVIRSIGRMAFPIYCFFLVEGFYYTKSKAKYALRLFIFALISEIPFDWAFKTYPRITSNGIEGLIPEITYQNVFVTLLIGLLTIWAMDELRILVSTKINKNRITVAIIQFIAYLICIVIGCVIAEGLRCDYGFAGVLAMAVIYRNYLPNGKDTVLTKKNRMIAFAFAVVILALCSSLLEAFAFIMLLPLAFYNGQRGKQNKYFFYAFYPGHILLLAIVGTLLSYYVW